MLRIRLFPRSRREWLRSAILWSALVVFFLGGCAWMFHMPGASYSGPLPPLTPAEQELSRQLEAHVRILAGEIGERNVPGHPEALARASEYIQTTFRGDGYRVTTQPYRVDGATVENVAAARVDASTRESIHVVGAHYDSVWGCPGANDNASGVAVTLELARLLALRPAARRVRFLAFVGNLGSRGLVQRGIAAFRRHAKFPSEGTAAPGALAGIGLSDHWSFWQAGYPGVMITDTAPFRYPYYHTASDTPDRVDYDRLARVTAGLSAMLEELCAQ